MRSVIIFLLVGSLSNSYGSGHDEIMNRVTSAKTKESSGYETQSSSSSSSSSSTDISEELNNIEEMLAGWIEIGKKNFIRSKKEKLELLEDEELGRSGSLVWKGIYSNVEKNIVNQPVAVKIFSRQKSFEKEFAVFEALNAANDPEIEKHGIPRVYYHGPVFDCYYGIAMTLFDGTLKDYYIDRDEHLSDMTVLSFLRQAVMGLKYLNSKNVLHNDLKPANLFVRGHKLFISDFDLSTLNGARNCGHTPVFASARFYANVKRNPMDDLESLVYSIWYISGVDMIRRYYSQETEGFLLSKCTKEQAVARVMQKLEHYKDPKVHEVMKFICVDEMLSDRPIPAYDAIIAKLNKAILN